MQSKADKSVMQIIASEPLLNHYYCRLSESARRLLYEGQFRSPEFGQLNQFASVEHYYDAQVRYLLGALLSLSVNLNNTVPLLDRFHPYPASDPDYRAAMIRFIRLEQHEWSLRTEEPKSFRLIGLELMHPNFDHRPSVDQAMKAIRERIDYSLQHELLLGNLIYLGHINRYTDSAVEGFSLAHVAIKHNRYDLVVELTRQGIEVDAFDNKGLTPLQRAVEQGYNHFIQPLVQAGADVNERSAQGDTALQLLMKTYQSREDDSFQDATNAKAMFRTLVGFGADLNLPFADGTEPLIYATEIGSIELLRLLVAGDGIRIRSEGDIYAEKGGKTALHNAILQLKQNPEKIELVKWVVMKLAYENSRNEDLALYYFSKNREAFECNAECASILLALIKSNRVKAGTVIERDELRSVWYGLVAMMYQDGHQLTKVETLPEQAVSAYQQVMERCVGRRDVGGEGETAKGVKRALLKEWLLIT